MEDFTETITVALTEDIKLITAVESLLALVDTDGTYLTVCCTAATEDIDIAVIVLGTLSITHAAQCTYRVTDTIVVDHLLDVQVIVAESHNSRVTVAVVEHHSHLVVTHIDDVADSRVRTIDSISWEVHGDVLTCTRRVDALHIRIADLSRISIVAEVTRVTEVIDLNRRACELHELTVAHLVRTDTGLTGTDTLGRSCAGIDITGIDTRVGVVDILCEAIKALCAIGSIAIDDLTIPRC